MFFIFSLFIVIFICTHFKIDSNYENNGCEVPTDYVPPTDYFDDFPTKGEDGEERLSTSNHRCSVKHIKVDLIIPELAILSYILPSLHGYVLEQSANYNLIFMSVYIFYSLSMIFMLYRILRYIFVDPISGRRFAYQSPTTSACD